MSVADTLTLAAPAKVNLFLHIVGRRADGYHLLESLFALIDLADIVTLTLRPDGAIERTLDLPGVPAADDLAVRAAILLKEATRAREGVSIAVDKRIPQGSGLGGGSSDAATVLLGLNRLWRLGLPREEIAKLGRALGADVPFFVHGVNAFVRGIGEIVEPVSLPQRWLALAMPAVHVPTGEIFAAPELTRTAPSAKITVFSESYGSNALQPVAASRYRDVASALTAWESLADVRMSGSGAAVFAACESETAAHDAIDALPAGVAGRAVRTLARHPLASFARRSEPMA
jgi:4-diphosphocytidyl-2-C-methyl-D-erythritol kinase